MKFYSTKGKSELVDFRTAVIKGIAEDGGLYLPKDIPFLPEAFFKCLSELSFHEIALTVTELFANEVSRNDLSDIIQSAFNFPVPTVKLDENLYVLELTHGPTLAFKDFGARFMAKMLSHFTKDEDKEVIILVATSGDTGSAVANGFYNVEGIKVVLLYPSGMVSKIQEQQLTTLGGNITALEIKGTFDDCQRLVKEAFADQVLNNKLNLTSANSINIARLIPQSLYYFHSFGSIQNKNKPAVFSVPSGNLGNLTGGILAHKMGLPVNKFIAAANANKVFPDYIKTGTFTPAPTIKTISNAMDVGNPSNFERIASIFLYDAENVRKVIFSDSFSDLDTYEAMNEIYKKYNYIIDPHGAVGYLANKKYSEDLIEDSISIILETAHPAKFSSEVKKATGIEIEIPERLGECLKKEKHSLVLSKEFNEFKSFLLETS
ncbi:MAG: threonine synthase [Ignavibacteriales bacterium]|nr:MAG: threonine synthase [Ignavibacteriales bacterium]